MEKGTVDFVRENDEVVGFGQGYEGVKGGFGDYGAGWILWVAKLWFSRIRILDSRQKGINLMITIFVFGCIRVSISPMSSCHFFDSLARQKETSAPRLAGIS